MNWVGDECFGHEKSIWITQTSKHCLLGSLPCFSGFVCFPPPSILFPPLFVSVVIRSPGRLLPLETVKRHWERDSSDFANAQCPVPAVVPAKQNAGRTGHEYSGKVSHSTEYGLATTFIVLKNIGSTAPVCERCGFMACATTTVSMNW